LWDVEDPSNIVYTGSSQMAASLLTSRTDRVLLYRDIFISLVHVSIGGRVNSRAQCDRKMRQIDTVSDIIGSRTRDLPTCSVVPQRLRYRMTPNYDSVYV
jgi:hypothetical protein